MPQVKSNYEPHFSLEKDAKKAAKNLIFVPYSKLTNKKGGEQPLNGYLHPQALSEKITSSPRHQVATNLFS